MSKTRIVVISDDSMAHTGFGAVVRNLFGTLQYDRADEIDLTCIACYPMKSDPKKPRRVPTVLSEGAGPDEHGILTLQKLVKAQGWPDVIFLLGDWWCWKHDLLNAAWKKQNRCLSSVWYYAPVDAVHLTEHAKPAYCSADLLIAMSPFGRDELERYTGRDDIVLLPHGYDSKIYRFRRKGRSKRTVFGVVSRNGQRKNIWAIVQAFLRLRLYGQMGLDLRLRLHIPENDFAGGDLRAWVRYLCARHDTTEEAAGIQWSSEVGIVQNAERNAASVAGWSDKDMAVLYRQDIDCLVSAGREGFGLPILEARACGCDIIVPEYSAPYSMQYDSAVSFPCIDTRVDGDAYSVLDIVPSVDELVQVMGNVASTRAQCGGPLLPLDSTDPRLSSPKMLTWQHHADTLFWWLKERGESSAARRSREALAFYRTPYTLLQPKEDKRIALVMPCSAGDVLLATAVAHSLVHSKRPEHRLVFVTQKQFFPIVEGCPWIHEVVEYNELLHNDYARFGRQFAAYYTPHFRTQVAGDWVLSGHGKQLAQTYADACGVALGDYWVSRSNSPIVVGKPYLTLHVSSGRGQHAARKYSYWDKACILLRKALPGVEILQVGAADDMPVSGTQDLRGKTTFPQLFDLLRGSRLHLGIDSMPMHAACILGRPTVALFGNTYPHLTGPHRIVGANFFALEPACRPCGRPCHQLSCQVKSGWSCSDLVTPERLACLATDTYKLFYREDGAQ